MRCAGIPTYDVQRANFHKKGKRWIYNIFAFLCICDGFLNFWECILGKYLQQKPKIFNKTTACSRHCPLRHPAPSLGHWYTRVYLRIFDPGPSNPTTFLGLCSPGDYRQSTESPMSVPPSTLQKSRLHSLFMIVFWEYGKKKVCYLTKVSHLDVELI